MFVGVPLPRPFLCGATPPIEFGRRGHRSTGHLSTGSKASYAPQPVDNCHHSLQTLYNLWITRLRLNIMDTVEYRMRC